MARCTARCAAAWPVAPGWHSSNGPNSVWPCLARSDWSAWTTHGQSTSNGSGARALSRGCFNWLGSPARRSKCAPCAGSSRLCVRRTANAQGSLLMILCLSSDVKARIVSDRALPPIPSVSPACDGLPPLQRNSIWPQLQPDDAIAGSVACVKAHPVAGAGQPEDRACLELGGRRAARCAPTRLSASSSCWRSLSYVALIR